MIRKPKKENYPDCLQAPGNSNNNKITVLGYDNSDRTQQAIILRYFLTVCSRLTSMKIRDDFAALHPAGRIKDLRDKGHRIILRWVNAPDLNGVMHEVGMYVYCGKDDLSESFWRQVVDSLSDDTGYWKLNKDQRYVFLKEYISEGLKPDDYEKAIKSLSDFLDY